MIREVIVGTRAPAGGTHIAPMGVHWEGNEVVVAPYRPSRTLDNLFARGEAVINLCDDVRVYAGCLTGRVDWPMTPADMVDLERLSDVPAHLEVEVRRVEARDSQRPRFYCHEKYAGCHKPFRGFNRAQAAVLEAAILYTRLDRLPTEKVRQELDYLNIAVAKTAGDAEREAWEWLMAGFEAHAHVR